MKAKGEEGVDEYLWGGGSMGKFAQQLWDGLLTNSSIHDARLKKMRLPIEAGRERRDR